MNYATSHNYLWEDYNEKFTKETAEYFVPNYTPPLLKHCLVTNSCSVKRART